MTHIRKRETFFSSSVSWTPCALARKAAMSIERSTAGIVAACRPRIASQACCRMPLAYEDSMGYSYDKIIGSRDLSLNLLRPPIRHCGLAWGRRRSNINRWSWLRQNVPAWYRNGECGFEMPDVTLRLRGNLGLRMDVEMPFRFFIHNHLRQDQRSWIKPVACRSK